MTYQPVNVAFGATAYGPLWAPAVSTWLQVIGYTARHCAIEQIGQVGGAGITDRTYTHCAENGLVEDFLANPALTHLFMTEMDMILPANAIVRLLEMDKDMASGVYFLRSDRPQTRGQPCLYKKAPMIDPKVDSAFSHYPLNIFPTDKPFRVDCSGLGCVLFKRKVFETLPRPWFDLAADKYGSDMYFYTHAKNAGLELWVDPMVPCGQIDYYTTGIGDWYWQLENNPAFGKSGYIIGLNPNSTDSKEA